MSLWIRGVFTRTCKISLERIHYTGHPRFFPGGDTLYCRIALSKSTDADMTCMHSMVRGHVVQDQVLKCRVWSARIRGRLVPEGGRGPMCAGGSTCESFDSKGRGKQNMD